MSGKVLFVCTANICRSPMAEFIFNDLAADRGLSLVAESAGVRAGPGHDMASHSRQALEEMGIDAEKHSSRRISREMVEDSSLVLTMEPWQAAEIENLLGPSDKIYVLPDYARINGEREVPDPYGLTLFAHRASARQISLYANATLDRMSRESQ